MTMELDRASIVDKNFCQKVLNQTFPLSKSDTLPETIKLDKAAFLELFGSQIISRHLDLLARKLREQQIGYYTIGSSGHEGNAAIAKVFRKNDIAFLHYRSGAFMVQRAKYCPGIDIIFEQILSLVASSDDPISGGRHKVFGSVPLFIPPQTSTIASHLPKAVGAAFSLTLAKKLKSAMDYTKLPPHSVVLCSFGDASVNHSTAQGAFNAAQWIVNAQIPLPLVFICEDNGLGISVPTPSDWIEKTIKNRIGFHYLACDGRNLADVYKAAMLAEHLARTQNKVVFLHMKTVRLLGHAGSDIEFQYRTLAEIIAAENDDPLLHSARIICEHQWMGVNEIIEYYESIRNQVKEASVRALQRPKLKSAKEIMAPIIPPKRAVLLPLILQENKDSTPYLHSYNMAQAINLTLKEVMSQYPNVVVFGEDVGKKGGVYRVTAALQEHFGAARVWDTLLDEQTILGTAMGLAHNGFLPIPEIQFLAYIHNAIDQLRGEAATLSFFSKGQFTNPMVIRIPGLGYQKGMGGHFHNDNAIGFLREIPGIVIACPSTATDAVCLLRECVRLAYQEQRVVIFLEPIALYMTKEIAGPIPDIQEKITLGELGVEEEAKGDTAIISYGNGMHLARLAAKKVKQEQGLSVKLIDLRWLAPLNTQSLYKEIANMTRVLIVDECRKTGSLSEELMTWMVENIHPLPRIHRITAEDCFIPLAGAWEYILPSCDAIVAALLALQKDH